MSEPKAFPVSQSNRFEVAYRAHRQQIADVEPQEVLPIDLNVDATVSRVLETLRRVRPLRSEIARQLPDFDITHLDRLEGYALALLYLQIGCERRQLAERALQGFLARGLSEYVALLAEAHSLAHHRRIDVEKLDRFSERRWRDPMGIASDLTGLVALFRESWSAIAGYTMLTSREVELAEHLALELTIALGRSSRRSQRSAEQRLLRAKAFTLVTRTYDELRRAVTCLGWQNGTAGHLIPSLYSDRAGARTPLSPGN